MLIVFSNVKLSIVCKFIKAAHLLRTCCRSGWLWLPVHWISTMDRVTGGGALQLALAGAGVLLLYRILVRLRPGASLQDAVVVITGASSGLGKGQPLFYLLFSLCVVSILIGQSKDYVQEVRSVVFVLIVNKKVCSPCTRCRVCKNIPCCWCSACSVWAKCSPPTAGGSGADNKSNRITTGEWFIVSQLKWSCCLLFSFWL